MHVRLLIKLNVLQVNSICWASVNYPDSHVLYPPSVVAVIAVFLLFVSSNKQKKLLRCFWLCWSSDCVWSELLTPLAASVYFLLLSSATLTQVGTSVHFNRPLWIFKHWHTWFYSEQIFIVRYFLNLPSHGCFIWLSPQTSLASFVALRYPQPGPVLGVSTHSLTRPSALVSSSAFICTWNSFSCMIFTVSQTWMVIAFCWVTVWILCCWNKI